MWGLVKPLYELSTARRERYGTLQCFLTGLGGEATFPDKSVFFWATKRSPMVSEKVCGRNVSGVTKKGFLRCGNFGTDGARCNRDADVACG